MTLELMVKQLERLQQELPKVKKHQIIRESMEIQYQTMLGEMREKYGLLREYQECKEWYGRFKGGK